MLPKYREPTHPGKILQEEFLEPLGLSQTALAKHLGWSHAKINEVINGKRGISPEVALSLADTLGTSPDLWMNLQTHYDLWHALKEHETKPRIAIAS